MNDQINNLEQVLYNDSIFDSLDKKSIIKEKLNNVYIFSQISKIFFEKILLSQNIHPNSKNINLIYPYSMLKPDKTFIIIWKAYGSLVFQNDTCSLICNKKKLFELQISYFLKEEQYIIIINMIIEAIKITDNPLKELFNKYL